MSSYATRRAGARRATQAANRYDREARQHLDALDGERAAGAKAAHEARQAADADAPRDVDSLRPGDLVRSAGGYWYPVLRVNAKSVTVDTGFSWTNRVPLAKIVETRKRMTT